MIRLARCGQRRGQNRSLDLSLAGCLIAIVAGLALVGVIFIWILKHWFIVIGGVVAIFIILQREIRKRQSLQEEERKRQEEFNRQVEEQLRRQEEELQKKRLREERQRQEKAKLVKLIRLRQEQRRQEDELRKQEEEKFNRSGIKQIDVMDGWQFERRMRIHFETMGWKVIQTPGSGDYGADLVLTSPDGRKVVIQLKRWQGPVGISAVDEVLRAQSVYHANSAMVITNSHLTKAALDYAKKNHVDVWEREELVKQLLDAEAEIKYSSQSLLP